MAELTKNVLGFEEFVQLPDEVKAQAIQTGFIDNEYTGGGSDDMTEPEFDMTDTEEGEGGMDYEFDITNGDEEETDDSASDEEGEEETDEEGEEETDEEGEEETDDFSFGEEGEGDEDSGIEDLDSEDSFSSDEEETDDSASDEEGEEETDDFSFGEEEGTEEEEEEGTEEEEEEETPAPKKAPKK